MSERAETTVARNGEGGPHLRKYVRVPANFDVTYVRDNTTDAKRGRASDLGGGGIRLATDEDLPLGAVLLMRFHLPGAGDETVARGRIVLSFFSAEEKRFFHGIAFTQIDPGDQQKIIAYVNNELAKSPPPV